MMEDENDISEMVEEMSEVVEAEWGHGQMTSQARSVANSLYQVPNEYIVEDIDSPLMIPCPNDGCSVGRTSLYKSIDRENDVIKCMWCNTEFELYAKVTKMGEDSTDE